MWTHFEGLRTKLLLTTYYDFLTRHFKKRKKTYFWNLKKNIKYVISNAARLDVFFVSSFYPNPHKVISWIKAYLIQRSVWSSMWSTLRDVSYSAFDVRKDDSYIPEEKGWRRKRGLGYVCGTATVYSSGAEVYHWLLWRKCRIQVLTLESFWILCKFVAAQFPRSSKY